MGIYPFWRNIHKSPAGLTSPPGTLVIAFCGTLGIIQEEVGQMLNKGKSKDHKSKPGHVKPKVKKGRY
jgi:hypothetical protein